MKISMLGIFWNISNEDIMVNKLLFVGTEELLVELKASALFAINVEVSHLFTCFLELSWILDVHDG